MSLAVRYPHRLAPYNKKAKRMFIATGPALIPSEKMSVQTLVEEIGIVLEFTTAADISSLKGSAVPKTIKKLTNQIGHWMDPTKNTKFRIFHTVKSYGAQPSHIARVGGEKVLFNRHRQYVDLIERIKLVFRQEITRRADDIPQRAGDRRALAAISPLTGRPYWNSAAAASVEPLSRSYLAVAKVGSKRGRGDDSVGSGAGSRDSVESNKRRKVIAVIAASRLATIREGLIQEQKDAEKDKRAREVFERKQSNLIQVANMERERNARNTLPMEWESVTMADAMPVTTVTTAVATRVDRIANSQVPGKGKGKGKRKGKRKRADDLQSASSQRLAIQQDTRRARRALLNTELAAINHGRDKKKRKIASENRANLVQGNAQYEAIQESKRKTREWVRIKEKAAAKRNAEQQSSSSSSSSSTGTGPSDAKRRSSSRRQAAAAIRAERILLTQEGKQTMINVAFLQSAASDEETAEERVVAAFASMYSAHMEEFYVSIASLQYPPWHVIRMSQEEGRRLTVEEWNDTRAETAIDEFLKLVLAPKVKKEVDAVKDCRSMLKIARVAAGVIEADLKDAIQEGDGDHFSETWSQCDVCERWVRVTNSLARALSADPDGKFSCTDMDIQHSPAPYTDPGATEVVDEGEESMPEPASSSSEEDNESDYESEYGTDGETEDEELANEAENRAAALPSSEDEGAEAESEYSELSEDGDYDEVPIAELESLKPREELMEPQLPREGVKRLEQDLGSGTDDEDVESQSSEDSDISSGSGTSIDEDREDSEGEEGSERHKPFDWRVTPKQIEEAEEAEEAAREKAARVEALLAAQPPSQSVSFSKDGMPSYTPPDPKGPKGPKGPKKKK